MKDKKSKELIFDEEEYNSIKITMSKKPFKSPIQSLKSLGLNIKFYKDGSFTIKKKKVKI